MREVTKADGSKAIVMNDEPKGKKVFPSDGIISTSNIEQVKARNAAAAAAKLEAEKKKVQNEKR